MVDLKVSAKAQEHGILSILPTGLTRLVLVACTLHGSSEGLAQLSRLTKLQHLQLTVLPGKRVTVDLPSDLLLHLVQLTHLQLSSEQLQSSAALQHLSALSALQHLGLSLRHLREEESAAAALSGLQHLRELTSFKLSEAAWTISLHTIPSLTKLTALHVLQFRWVSLVDPAVLAWASQLQELHLHCTRTWSAEGAAALLAAVGQQHELTKLHIECEDTWHTPSAAAYAGLTASSHLQHLELINPKLPAAAWQHMFPPARYLPELQCIVLQHARIGDAGAHGGSAQQEGTGLQLSQADMQAMVSCCPGLDTLTLFCSCGVSDVAPLQQLTGLTSVELSTAFQDNASSIAQLTGLQRLTLTPLQRDDSVMGSRLLQLTALQQLRVINIDLAACDPALKSVLQRERSLQIGNKAPAGGPPDVWLQLKELCGKALAAAERLAVADTMGQITV